MMSLTDETAFGQPGWRGWLYGRWVLLLVVAVPFWLPVVSRSLPVVVAAATNKQKRVRNDGTCSLFCWQQQSEWQNDMRFADEEEMRDTFTPSFPQQRVTAGAAMKARKALSKRSLLLSHAPCTQSTGSCAFKHLLLLEDTRSLTPCRVLYASCCDAFSFPFFCLQYHVHHPKSNLCFKE